MPGQTHECIVCNKEHHGEHDRYFCSAECEKKWKAKYDWEQEHTHESDSGAICPFCEHEHIAGGDHPDLYDENTCEFECENCRKKFAVEARCSWSWETKPLDDEYPDIEDIEEDEEKSCLKSTL